jgi:hypothetical protein
VIIRPSSRRAAAGRIVRSAAGIAGGTLGWLVPATPAMAHGEVTGVQDVVQDYGVLLFLVATVLIGAGVLAWVTFSPQPDEEAADGEETPAFAAAERGDGASGPVGTGAPAVTGPPPGPAAPTRPEGSRGSR